MTDDKLPQPIWSLTFKEILDHCQAAYEPDEALRRALIEAKKSSQTKKDT